MRKSAIGLVVAGVAASLVLAACSSSKKSSSSSTPAGGNTSAATSAPATSSSAAAGAIDGKGAKVGIIWPDTQSSNRWITSDPDAAKAECQKVNLNCTMQNANGDAGQMTTDAQNMINQGVKVLLIVNLDSASAAKIESDAKAKGVATIDYDRFTLGGSASLYVSFDGVAVGKEQGQTLVQCPQVKGKSTVNYVDINGSKTDNNATLFKQGYDSVLSKQTGWKKLADQWIKDWDNQTAGTTFQSMLNTHKNLNAVMVANDGMANAVITTLKQQHLNGQVAVSGQDATVQGLQHIMDGDQCFTIYKPSSKEAIPAIDAAAQLANGQVPQTNTTVTDSQTGRKVPAILAQPIAITKANVALPINDGYTPKAQTCTGAYAAKCTAAGVK
ncbi:MAG TPA: substrate-binding domain-containing protein [Jatrophihabitantaceae bacterium]|jgi:D-xylose transport system substrate-binding protein